MSKTSMQNFHLFSTPDFNVSLNIKPTKCSAEQVLQLAFESINVFNDGQGRGFGESTKGVTHGAD